MHYRVHFRVEQKEWEWGQGEISAYHYVTDWRWHFHLQDTLVSITIGAPLLACCLMGISVPCSQLDWQYRI